MKIETLISTMDLNNIKSMKKLLNQMNLINKHVLIINQSSKTSNLFEYENEYIKLLSFNEKGLSKSRNKAIDNSNLDICVIADDDLIYCNDFENKIKSAYKKYSDADIIAFYVENAKNINSNKEGKIDLIHSLKICSVQITFKRSSIVSNNIKFDELFGTGSEIFNHGEENIFLSDAIKCGLKIYYVPQKIAILNNNNSSWFKGYNNEFLKSKGALFYRISSKIYLFLILQFAIRKRKNLNQTNFFETLIQMKKGTNLYKKITRR